MRKSLVFSFLVLLLAMVMLAPAASGAGVNVLDVKDGYDKVDNASGTITYTWIAYNNDTMDYLIQVDAALGRDANGNSPSGVALSVPQDYGALAPGESRQVVVSLTADRSVPTEEFSIYVNITFTQMDDPSHVQTVSKVVNAHVKAMFESTGNKVFGLWENNLPAPFNSLFMSFVLTMVGWFLIAGFIYFVVDPVVHQFTKKTRTDLDDRILEVTRMPIFALVVIFGLVDSLSILDIPQDWHVTFIQLYQILVAVVLAYTAYRIFDKVVIYYAEKWAKTTDTEIDDVVVPLMHKLGVVFIPIAALIAVLNIIGVNVTLLVAGMGVIGLILSFALQETLGNFFAGLQLLMDRPFKIGDIIELESGEICEVRKIGLRSTQVYNTSDHEIIILPNNDVVNKKVVNYSRPDQHRSMNAEVGVAYGSDLDKVKRVLLDIANTHPDVIKQEGQMPYVRVAKLNDSSVDFKLWYWVDVKKMWRVASEIRQTVYDRFNQEGIEIPFPQSVVTFKNDPSRAGK